MSRRGFIWPWNTEPEDTDEPYDDEPEAEDNDTAEDACATY